MNDAGTQLTGTTELCGTESYSPAQHQTKHVFRFNVQCLSRSPQTGDLQYRASIDYDSLALTNLQN